MLILFFLFLVGIDDSYKSIIVTFVRSSFPLTPPPLPLGTALATVVVEMLNRSHLTVSWSFIPVVKLVYQIDKVNVNKIKTLQLECHTNSVL